jgi:hypothetical protein
MQQDRGEERDDEKIEQVKDGGGPGTGNEGGCLSVCICACGNVWFLLASLFVFRRRWQFRSSRSSSSIVAAAAVGHSSSKKSKKAITKNGTGCERGREGGREGEASRQ